MAGENTTGANSQAQATAAANAGATATAENTNPVTPTEGQKAEPYKAFATKEDFDNHAAGIKHSARQEAEKEAEKSLLAQLGLAPADKDKLAAVKKAYEESLSAEEKANLAIKTLQENCNTLAASAADKDATIQALCMMAGKTESEVSDIVKMARAIANEALPIDAAIKRVMDMVGGAKPNEQAGGDQAAQKPSPMPKGITILQPDSQQSKEPEPKDLGEAVKQFYTKKQGGHSK